MESPDYVRLSIAADIALGFSNGRFKHNVKPYCINLLLHFNDGCKANCLYCGQAREISKGATCKTLIRVEWPLRSLNEVIERLREVQVNGCSLRPFRICVASVTNRRAVKAEIEVIRRVYNALRLPISALISPTIFGLNSLKELRDSGTERIGIAIDCATREIFDMLRGREAQGPHSWDRYIEGIKEAVSIFGRGRVGIHLIVGLGETEMEAVNLIQEAHDIGAETHLFSFYPEGDSILERWIRPPISQYRRVQLARYLINNGFVRSSEMIFNSYGQIINFGVSSINIRRIIEFGEAFITSGCPGCTRPFANERPGEQIRNYPYPPDNRESKKFMRQIETYIKPRNTLKTLKNYLKNRIKAAIE
ncbi:MAG: radical SAM protein [Candidatus Methanomethylicia archaeon]